MQVKRKTGVVITEADGTPLTSGLYYYWDADLSQILLQEAHDFCPDVNFKQKEAASFETCFHKDTAKGVELCGTSKSLDDKGVQIPESDLDRFIAAIDQLHAKSERPGVPEDSRSFMRDFVVPNPLTMRSAWRVSTGFSKRLLVLWGYSSAASEAVVLPLTPTSEKWEDAAQRVDLKKLLASSGLISKHKFNWGKFFRVYPIRAGETDSVMCSLPVRNARSSVLMFDMGKKSTPFILMLSASRYNGFLRIDTLSFMFHFASVKGPFETIFCGRVQRASLFSAAPNFSSVFCGRGK